MSSIAEANNKFAFSLYKELKDLEGNIFFSPFSISSVGAMLYEGADGKTEEQIKKVFNFPKDKKLLRSSYSELLGSITQPGKEYKLHIANALWVEQTYRLLGSYVHNIQTHYDGEAKNMYFRLNPGAAREVINSWIEEHTENRIKNLFDPGSVDRLTKLILTNAVYFKGDWGKQFDKDDTEDENFNIAKGKIVEVPMMKMVGKNYFGYAEDERMQALEMLYKGNELSMTVLLPKDNNLGSLEDYLDLERFSDLRKKVEEVHIWMPKFEFNRSYNLTGRLTKMGMDLPFGSQADFSGMDGSKDLFVDKIVQGAYVKVDEEGTEAAAATGATMLIKAVMPEFKFFKVDHPFMFLIKERYTNTILFMGRVVDPRARAISTIPF